MEEEPALDTRQSSSHRWRPRKDQTVDPKKGSVAEDKAGLGRRVTVSDRGQRSNGMG